MSVTEQVSTVVDADEQRVVEAVERLLAEHPPADTPEQQFLEAQFDAGLAWVQFAEGDGGLGVSPKLQKLVAERIKAAGGPLGGAKNPIGYGMCGPAIETHGTPEQKQLLRPLFSNEHIWCQLFSEPGAGSDVASLSMKAERDGDEWIVNGQKIWTSGAWDADWCYLIARTDPTAPAHAGLSEFVVDMSSPGIEVRRIVDATGNAHFCEVYFDDVVVPGDHLVGTLNDSFRQVMRQMEHERGGIDRLVSNRRLYLDAVAEADLHDPLLRDEWARLESEFTIGRMLVLREVLRQAPPGFSAATKTFCTEFEQRVAEFCVRAAGARAMRWNRVSRNIVYAPAYTIMGGTSNILRNIIGERLLGLPREPRPG